MSIEIAVIGAQRPFVAEALENEFTVHNVHAEADPAKALAAVADRIRGVATHAMVGLPAWAIEALPKLEICAINGVGLETTDLALAGKRGITVTTTPVLYDDVADLGVILAMNACRRIVEADRFLRAGRWLKGRMPLATKFSGRKAGILGLGRIGAALAPRLQAFGIEVAYYDPVPKEGVPYRSFGSAVELARFADILFLAAAGGAGRAHIVTSEILDALGPDGVFVNIARGWLVDEAALVQALVEKRIRAAGLDVFEDEPRVPAELLALDNVVLTPHIASSTEETMTAMGNCVLDNLRSWFAGRGAVTPVT